MNGGGRGDEEEGEDELGGGWGENYVEGRLSYTYRIVPSKRPPPNFDSFVVFGSSPCNRPLC